MKSGKSRNHRVNILIAEDSRTQAEQLRFMLEQHGYQVTIAANGKLALQAAQVQTPALIISDIVMPEMDGYELTAAIRAAETNKTRIPIIAFTANAIKGEAEHCLALGMDDYLSKPVQIVNLKSMLDKWLPVAQESMSTGPHVSSHSAARITHYVTAAS